MSQLCRFFVERGADMELICLECNHELHFLDTIVNLRDGKTFELFVCRNEACDSYGQDKSLISLTHYTFLREIVYGLVR